MPTRAPLPPATTLAGRLRRARENAGLNREQLAVAIGRGFESVSAYESGRVDPPVRVVIAIAQACGTTVGDLLDGIDGTTDEAQPCAPAAS